MGAFAKEIVDGVKMIQIPESDHSVNTRTKHEIQGRIKLQAGQSYSWEEEEVSEG